MTSSAVRTAACALAGVLAIWALSSCQKITGKGDPVKTARNNLEKLEKKIETYKEKRHALKVESIFRRKKAERLEGRAETLKASIQKLATAVASGTPTVAMFGKQLSADQVRRGVPMWHRSFMRLEREKTLMQNSSEQYGKAAEVMEKNIETLQTSVMNLRMKIDELELLRDEAEMQREIQDVFGALSGTGGSGEISGAIRAIEDQIDRLGAEMEATSGEVKADVPSAAELIFLNESWGADEGGELDDVKILAQYGLE